MTKRVVKVRIWIYKQGDSIMNKHVRENINLRRAKITQNNIAALD
jgi:hypothetical protein